MISFKDSLGFERVIDVNRSYNKNYINFTTYVPSKNVAGYTIQIPIAAFKELVEFMKKVESECQ